MAQVISRIVMASPFTSRIEKEVVSVFPMVTVDGVTVTPL